MSIPVSEVNIIGTRAYAVTDLGLAATLTSADIDTSTPISTGTGATVLVLAQLSSGDGDLLIDIADTAANLDFSSPSQTITLTGTTMIPAVQQTTASATYIGFQVEPGASGLVWDTSTDKTALTVLVLYERLQGMEWHSIASSINMFFSELNGVSFAGDTDTLATGSGNLDLSDMVKPQGRI